MRLCVCVYTFGLCSVLCSLCRAQSKDKEECSCRVEGEGRRDRTRVGCLINQVEPTRHTALVPSLLFSSLLFLCFVHFFLCWSIQELVVIQGHNKRVTSPFSVHYKRAEHFSLSFFFFFFFFFFLKKRVILFILSRFIYFFFNSSILFNSFITFIIIMICTLRPSDTDLPSFHTIDLFFFKRSCAYRAPWACANRRRRARSFWWGIFPLRRMTRTVLVGWILLRALTVRWCLTQLCEMRRWGQATLWWGNGRQSIAWRTRQAPPRRARPSVVLTL